MINIYTARVAVLVPVGSEASFCHGGHDILGLVMDRDSLKLFDNGSVMSRFGNNKQGRPKVVLCLDSHLRHCEVYYLKQCNT